MSVTTVARPAIRGAGRRTLEAKLANRETFKTSGSLWGERTGSFQPSFPEGCYLNPKETERFYADREEGITYTVYSYSTPIAWVKKDGSVYHVEQRFSATTSKHQGIVAVYL